MCMAAPVRPSLEPGTTGPPRSRTRRRGRRASPSPTRGRRSHRRADRPGDTGSPGSAPAWGGSAPDSGAAGGVARHGLDRGQVDRGRRCRGALSGRRVDRGRGRREIDAAVGPRLVCGSAVIQPTGRAPSTTRPVQNPPVTSGCSSCRTSDAPCSCRSSETPKGMPGSTLAPSTRSRSSGPSGYHSSVARSVRGRGGAPPLRFRRWACGPSPCRRAAATVMSASSTRTDPSTTPLKREEDGVVHRDTHG